MLQSTSVKMERKLIQLLDKICKLRGETRTSFIRRAVLRELANLSYLDDKSKKALGVENGK